MIDSETLHKNHDSPFSVEINSLMYSVDILNANPPPVHMDSDENQSAKTGHSVVL